MPVKRNACALLTTTPELRRESWVGNEDHRRVLEWAQEQGHPFCDLRKTLLEDAQAIELL